MLEIRALSKTYPGERLGAVDNVNLSIEQGEIVSIIGRSGSGKTTLLRMLAGLMTPDRGQILFQGIPFSNPEDQLIAGHPSVKMVFQDYELMPNMTVNENIGYQLLDLIESERAERVSELLELCNLSGFGYKLPKQLSGGQQQRLSLARALAQDPEVLLLDEPFSSIDPIGKQLLLLEIQKISRDLNISLIVVTHDTNDAMLISDRIGFMSHGQLIQIDTPGKLYHQPKSAAIAKFMGIVNEYNREEASSMGWEIPLNHNQLIIRAESIKVADEGVNIKIVESRLLGKDYLNHGKTVSGKEILFYSKEALSDKRNKKVQIDESEFLYY